MKRLRSVTGTIIKDAALKAEYQRMISDQLIRISSCLF